MLMHRCLPVDCLHPAGAANMLAGQKKNCLRWLRPGTSSSPYTPWAWSRETARCVDFTWATWTRETELIAQAMAAVRDLYREGKIKPRIDSTYHLEQVNEWVSDGSAVPVCVCVCVCVGIWV